MSQRVFLFCWLAYTVSYIGRINYSATLTSLIQDIGITKSQAGLIGTAFFFCYGFGQFINGMIGDRVSQFKMITTGLALAAVSNLAMSFCHSYRVMIVIWGFNGVFQSMLWSPLLSILSTKLQPELRFKACLYIATSTPAGTLLAYFISMLVLRNSIWAVVYRISGILLFLVAAVWLALTIRIPHHLVEEQPEEKPALQNAQSADQDPRNAKFFPLLMASGAVIMLAGTLIHGMLKEGVSVWVPTMISESYNTSPSFSVFLSMLLPVFSFFGPYILSYFYKRQLKQNETYSAIACLVACIPVFSVLLFIGKAPVIISVVMLALITLIMHAFNYVMVTLIPVRFAPYKKTATATGLMNSVTYMGCALSTYGFGFLSERFGWNKTVLFWISLTLVGVLIFLFVIKRWKKFIR